MTLPPSSTLKLNRARQLITELTRETDAYIESGAVRLDPILRLREPTPTWDIYLRHSSAAPMTWGPVIGDVLHNARSALDTFAFDVITTRTPSLTEKERRKIAFPIVDDPREFDTCHWQRGLPLSPGLVTAFRWAQPWRDMELAVTGGIITAVQLANHVKYRPLRWLRDLNNQDKHRTIHTAIGALEFPWALLSDGTGAWINTAKRPLADGDLVGTFRVTEAMSSPPAFDGRRVVTLPIPDIDPSAIAAVGDELERMCSAVETAAFFVEDCLAKQDSGVAVGP
jgi:hypothetical protein